MNRSEQPNSRATTDRCPPSYVVTVTDQRAEALTGRDGETYTCPPQSEQQARQLAALLAGATVTGRGPWRHAIAGGQRTIGLHPSP